MSRKMRNILLILIAMALTVLMCCVTTPQDVTISAIQARQPVLGVAWALATSLAALLNMEELRRKSGVNNLCFRIFLWIGALAALLTPFTLEESPIGVTLPFMNLHRLGAIIFAVVTYVALITLLLVRSRTCGKLCIVFALVLAAVGGLNVYGIFALSSFISALMETCLILVGFTVLLLANYVVPEPSDSETVSPAAHGKKLTATAISVATLVLLLCGITTIPSYRVQDSGETVAERRIPESGYVEVESEYLRIALPESWQERKYSDMVAYYDDVDRNSMSVTYEVWKNFDNIPKFNVIQNLNVTSSKLIDYMGHPMLVIERRENGLRIYSYMFNCADQTVNVTLTFTSEEADVHDEIFHSILIWDEPNGETHEPA